MSLKRRSDGWRPAARFGALPVKLRCSTSQKSFCGHSTNLDPAFTTSLRRTITLGSEATRDSSSAVKSRKLGGEAERILEIKSSPDDEKANKERSMTAAASKGLKKGSALIGEVTPLTVALSLK